jgi:hypothetical protein
MAPTTTEAINPIAALSRARRLPLIHCFDDGRLNLDNNPVDRAPRGGAIDRKNYLFAASIAAASQ